MPELIRKLQAGEESANGRTILRVPEPLEIEKYMREAGYGEAYNYAVLWQVEKVIRHFYFPPTTTAMTAANDVVQRIFYLFIYFFHSGPTTARMWGEFETLICL